MPRQIDMSKPLSDEDVAYLRSRHSDAYVDRMINLAAEAVPEEQPESPGEGPESPEEGLEGTPATTGPEGPGEGNEGTETALQGDEEDLLGSSEFNPLEHTEAEIKEHLKDSDAAEKERVLAVEAERQDREPRKGVLAL